MLSRRIARGMAFVAVPVFAFAACMQIFGIKDGTPIGASADGGVDTGDPAACDPYPIADDAAGVFVASVGADDDGCGTRQAPCATIGRGIDQAVKRSRTIVYVATGRYVERVDLRGNVRVEGGWAAVGSTWTPICPRPSDATIVVAPPTESVTVTAKGLESTATIANFTIKSKDRSAVRTGESIYGILANGPRTVLSIDNVQVVVVSAGDGVPGGEGDGGAPADENTADASPCLAANASATGSPGADGPPGPEGSFDLDGYVPSRAQGGAQGAVGVTGADGGAPNCLTSCQNCGSAVPPGCTAPPYDLCTSPGRPGCGGHGGTGGAPGGGGGASIALYTWDANVRVTRSSFTSGAGGAGASGGKGGPGGPGSSGASGIGATSCSSGCGNGGSFCTSLTLKVTSVPDGGGVGGGGGPGGTGAGGAGGWSVAAVAGSDAGAIGIDDATHFVHGSGGTGANGSPNGRSAEKYP